MCKVTIVDDCKELRTGLAHVLTAEGYSVTVHDGKEGVVRHLCHEKPDIIILDYMLGGKTGADIVRRLRNESCTHAQIVALSAHPSAQLSMANEQVFAFIQKPFTTEELLAKIKQLTSRQEVFSAGSRT